MSQATYTIHDPDDPADLKTALEWSALYPQSRITISREAVICLLERVKEKDESVRDVKSSAFHLPPNAEVSISEGAVTIRIPIAGTAPPGDRTARAAERLADDLRRLQPHP